MKVLRSLRSYLSIQFGVVAALPVVIITILLWRSLVPQMCTSTGIQQEGMARSIASQISAHLLGGERQLAALADFMASEKQLPESQVTGLLDAQCGDGELFETIYIASSPSGIINRVGLARLRRSKRDDLLGLDLSGRHFNNTAGNQEKAAWSETFLSTASSRLAVALTIPMGDSVIIGEITLDNLSEFISHLPVDGGSLTMVLDRQGRIVADSQRLRWGQQLGVEAILASTPEGKVTVASRSFELEGRPFLGTVVAVDRLGWTVLVAQPLQMANRPMRSAFISIGLGLAIALVLALTLAWLRAGNLSRLFRSYSEMAQTISRGEYNFSRPRAKTTEFINLGQSLAHMARMIRQREKDLMDSETRMRITLDSIGDAVIATDAQGSVVRMNPMAEKLTGWPSAEASGRHLTEVLQIINAHTRQPVANPVEKVLAHGDIVGLANHTMLIARDGRKYQIADSGAPIRHPDGRIVGVVLVFRDVTDAYYQEQQIRENEKRLKDITANVPGVVYQFKSTGDHVYSTTFVSEKAVDLFGLAADPGTFLEEFYAHIPDRDLGRFTGSVREAVDNAIPWHYEGRFIKPGGEEIWFSGNAVPHQEADTIVYYGVLMDVTRRKQMADSLRLTQFCFDKASIGIFLVDVNAHILNVNDQGCHSLGYSREELCKMTIFDIDPNFRPDMWPEHIRNLRQVKSRTIETLHRHKRGGRVSRSNLHQHHDL